MKWTDGSMLLPVLSRLFNSYLLIIGALVATVGFRMIGGFVCGKEQGGDIGIGHIRGVCCDSQRNGDPNLLIFGYFMGCIAKCGENSFTHYFSGG